MVQPGSKKHCNAILIFVCCWCFYTTINMSLPSVVVHKPQRSSSRAKRMFLQFVLIDIDRLYIHINQRSFVLCVLKVSETEIRKRSKRFSACVKCPNYSQATDSNDSDRFGELAQDSLEKKQFKRTRSRTGHHEWGLDSRQQQAMWLLKYCFGKWFSGWFCY